MKRQPEANLDSSEHNTRKVQACKILRHQDLQKYEHKIYKPQATLKARKHSQENIATKETAALVGKHCSQGNRGRST
jgi:hypothetical protein